LQRKLILLFSCVTVSLCTISPRLFGQEAAQSQTKMPKMKAYSWVKPGPSSAAVEVMKSLAATGSSNTLPLFTFFTESSRDQIGYTGVMVGRDPFHGGGSVSVPTFIVPLIIKTNTIGTGINGKGIISTKPGHTTFDPTVADKACLTAPNNVPLTLFQESPIFNPADFNFGGTDVGTTQYVDAFQRANFWQIDDHDTFHTLLGPVKTLSPIVINVPAKDGTTLPTSLTGTCATEGIVDINWFDAFLDSTVIPALVSQGVNPSNFPLFLVHNLVWASPATDLNTCCIIGYHGFTGLPIQTYSPVDFDDNTGFFASPEIRDTYPAAHEVAEWMDDPFDNNPTPPWGHVGQVGGCSNALEVGDPLTGTQSLRIAGSNGFTYNLQELAFFSWFFGAPSIGIHGWFSNNATFLTDAGPPCQ
jgi:hypothetical protein